MEEALEPELALATAAVVSLAEEVLEAELLEAKVLV